MSRNKTILIIGASIALLFIVFAALTEYRDVPAHEWKERYSYKDEQPQGLFIFKELVTRYYEDIPSTLNGYPEDTVNQNSLYIQFVPDYLAEEVADTLISIAAKGNDVLIIADYFNDIIADTVSTFFDDVFLRDSLLEFNFTDSNIALDTPFIYQFHDRKFIPNIPTDFVLMGGLNWEEDKKHIRVASNDSLALFTEFPFGEGRIFYHVKKDLFYNYSYRQDFMFDYTQRVLSHFDPKHVYLLSPIQLYGSNNSPKRTPLDYIMSQPALKIAYYLMVLGALIYVFLGGKRKQKIIPVVQKNKNTSLEYVDTVSQLFYQQDQPEKLARHMKNIFYYKMQKKFYISQDHPDYINVLSKKSKIPVITLQYIMDRFQNAEQPNSFRGDQLVSLNRKLETIYKEMDDV
ncbi:MAG: hypothetical protein P1U56_01560 [Saprospiraceae bacterium]|nr:hypothetical protein [Saprospiraceae bacterium]